VELSQCNAPQLTVERVHFLTGHAQRAHSAIKSGAFHAQDLVSAACSLILPSLGTRKRQEGEESTQNLQNR